MSKPLAKNSHVVKVSLEDFYSEDYKNRVCCFCGAKLQGGGAGRPKVACSDECKARARAIAEKTLRGMACVICGEALSIDRASSKRLCNKPQCKKETDWRRNLFRVHHIRAEHFYNLIQEQDWGCAVCKEPLFFAVDGTKSQINVDHDHSCCPGRIGCGKCVRGVLCNGCNGGMGLFKDSPDNLVSAAQYLIAYRERG